MGGAGYGRGFTQVGTHEVVSDGQQLYFYVSLLVVSLRTHARLSLCSVTAESATTPPAIASTTTTTTTTTIYCSTAVTTPSAIVDFVVTRDLHALLSLHTIAAADAP
eukprot:GHVU01033014.1.p2 GENE.GHVU01033014.1~~GHVU01033014.1.p2  ORF type:complete len:107 (+),score=6.90 GHVU01033014.1:75-395(+)